MLTPEEMRLLGGSDAAAIAGVHPHKSPIDVWRRVVQGVEEPGTKQMRRGNLMEPVIREMAREDYKLSLLGPRKLRNTKRPHIRASLDDVNKTADTEEPVEFKSVSPWAAEDYGMGDDEVPQHHICQVQFYMNEAGAPRARLFALIGVDDLRHYTIHADADIQGMLLEAVDKFHRDYIVPQRPPPPDHSEGYADYLARKFPSDDGRMLPPSAKYSALSADLRSIKAQAKKLEAQEALIRNQILAELGDASGVEGLFTYKWTRGRAVTDWSALATELKVPPEVVERHTRRSPFRVLRMKGGKNE